jgi:hypothetical protein
MRSAIDLTASVTAVSRPVVVKQAPESSGTMIREWIAAIGTLSAVWLSFYIGVWREWKRRPLVGLTFDPEDFVRVGGAASPPDSDEQLPADLAVVRLRIQNAEHKVVAEDAEVIVLGVTEVEAHPGKPRASIKLDGQSLVWTNSNPLANRIAIPAGVFRRVDLGSVVRLRDRGCGMPRPGSGHQQGDPRRPAGHPASDEHLRFEVGVYPPPLDKRHYLTSAKLEFDLLVTARNANAARYKFVMTFNGRWDKEWVPDVAFEQPRQVSGQGSRRRPWRVTRRQ